MPQLSAGQTAPDFTLTSAQGEQVTLSEFRGRKVIVYFYPAAMTPGCTKEACDFRDSFEMFDSRSITVLGISPDDPEKLARFTQKEDLTFTLLSDPDRKVLTEWGAFGEKKNYGKIVQGVIRSTVVIDETGTVMLAKYNVKATGHVARLISELESAGVIE